MTNLIEGQKKLATKGWPWIQMTYLWVIGTIFCALPLLCIVVISLLTFSGKAHAGEVGTCQSLDPYFRNIPFYLEETASISEAESFTEKVKGIMVTDHSRRMYSIIWSDKIWAPECQYQCSRFSQG